MSDEGKVSILIVEDEFAIAQVIKEIVLFLGYEVMAVIDSGEEAVEEVCNNLPDLVLMDIKLKGKMNGIEAAHQINAVCDVPIVYLTSYADVQTLDQAKQTGLLGYIIKPFDKKELSIIISAALYNAKKEKQCIGTANRCYLCLKDFHGIIFRRRIDFMPIFMKGAVEDITGYSSEKFVGGDLTWEEIIYAEDRSDYALEIQSRIEGQIEFPINHEYRIVRNDKKITWVKEVIRGICDKSGKPVYVQGTICDHFESKKNDNSQDTLLKDACCRENRIIELKKEVNVLCKNSGNQPKYDLTSILNKSIKKDSF